MAKKMNNFLGHCFLSPSNSLVFLAKISFLGQFLLYSWLKSNHPLTFVCTSLKKSGIVGISLQIQ